MFALNLLFADCPRLEYLRVSIEHLDERDEYGPPFGLDGLTLPPRLRYLVIRERDKARYDECDQPTLSQANCRTLAGNLRALRVRQKSWRDPPSLVHIAALVNLTYLGIEICETIEASFLTALESLHSLRALELRNSPGSTMVAFPQHCTPLLEHLTIGAECVGLLAEELLPAATHFTCLKSLSVIGWYVEGGWGWLETVLRRGQLEYLHLDSMEVPMEMLAMAIKCCKVGEYR